MRTVRRTLRADLDLDQIWRYTAEKWSAEQAFRYLDLIDSVIGKIAERPSLLRAAPELGQHISFFPAGSHYLFVREENDGELVILAILHQRMDAKTRLSDE